MTTVTCADVSIVYGHIGRRRSVCLSYKLKLYDCIACNANLRMLVSFEGNCY